MMRMIARVVSVVGLLIVIAGWLVVVWYAIGDRNPTVGFKIMLVGWTLAIVPFVIGLVGCLWVGGVKK